MVESTWVGLQANTAKTEFKDSEHWWLFKFKYNWNKIKRWKILIGFINKYGWKYVKSTERSEVISKSDQIHLENKDKHS